ncbi:MAG TPA: hypothetical protein VK679_01335 [Gemmatimonadaceae bacterium]|jgi:hypothetical protein|nr:hypothetical protein [Gemmatimonadaceae bacterium]
MTENDEAARKAQAERLRAELDALPREAPKTPRELTDRRAREVQERRKEEQSASEYTNE